MSSPRSARSQKPKGEPKRTLNDIFDSFFRAQSRQFYNLLGVSLLLVVLGLVMVLSSSSIDSLKNNGDSFAVFGKQVLFAIIGLIGMAFVSLLPVSFFRQKAGLLFVIALAVQVAVFVTPLGVTVNGNTNWLRIGIFTLQPSEFLKLTLILFISAFMAIRFDEMFDARRFMWPVLGRGAIVIAIVMAGQDLGTTIIIVLILFGSLFLAGTPGVSLRLPLLVVILAGAVAASSGSRARRILAWLNPSDDSSPYTWQSLHGVWALAAGRITGAGLGQSRLKWSWIPEVENDFIFAIIGEEFGLIGALSVIALFLFLFGSMIQIFLRTEDNFSRFVAGGILVWISLQSIINIMVVLQLAPVLGVPLPLISAGGSSLISSLLAIGVMLGIERQNHASASVRGSRRPTRSAASQAAAKPRARN